jgi:hypothetical protein
VSIIDTQRRSVALYNESNLELETSLQFLVAQKATSLMLTRNFDFIFALVVFFLSRHSVSASIQNVIADHAGRSVGARAAHDRAFAQTGMESAHYSSPRLIRRGA